MKGLSCILRIYFHEGESGGVLRFGGGGMEIGLLGLVGYDQVWPSRPCWL